MSWADNRYRNLGRVRYSTGFEPERLSETRKREAQELRALSSVNLIILMGNLGQDPELKVTDRESVCTFSLATKFEWRDELGKTQEKVQWHKVKVFGRAAESCKKWLKKGSSVYLEGKISTSKWTDRDGKDYHSAEIHAHSVTFTGYQARLGAYQKEE